MNKSDKEIINEYLYGMCNIDVPLFREQRRLLANFVETPKKYKIDSKHFEAIEGILNLTDFIYDFLTDHADLVEEIKFDHNL